MLAIPSLIAMVNTLTISVIERTREIGMLRAVGGTRKQVRTMIIAEALLLSAIGTALTKAGEIRDNSAANKYPTFNIHQGKYRLEMSRFLDNPKIPGGSAKAWYLLAEPADLAAIEVVFLNGQESPTIESTDADFSTLGIQLRGYHDFGVAKQDPRAAVKAAGV